MAVIRRRFATVGDRRVHYLRAGEGPPCLLIHSSPANAWLLAPLIERLSADLTCFAFDTPGFGDSDPLSSAVLDVADLADAIAANMDAVGLGACPVFGTHSGAAIATLLAARHPEKVTGVVLDGPPLFTEAERGRLFDGYFEPLEVDDRGGHFARAWTRFRDQSIWFPWRSRAPDRLNPTGLSTTAFLQFWTSSYFACGRTYGPAYRAAVMTFESAMIAEVVAPMVITALETDMLYPHLDRLPPLRPTQHVRRIGASPEGLSKLIHESLTRFAASAPSSPEAEPRGVAGRVFVDLPHGQMHVRIAGAEDAPTLLYLHDAPGSARRDSALVDALSRRFRVIAPDLPGCADSAPLPAGRKGGDDFANACRAVCAKLGVSSAIVYGQGIGAAIGLHLARRDAAFVCRLVLRSLPAPTADERARWRGHMAPPIEVTKDGSHWYRTWLMLRDSLVFFPWFETRPQNFLRVEADFDGDVLHDWTLDVMRQHGAYQDVVDAALGMDMSDVPLVLSRPPVMVSDPRHRFASHHQRTADLCRSAPELSVQGGNVAHADDLHTLLSVH